jgi:chaperonin GroEL
VDDALNATRAAVQEGVVPGGGTALVHAGKILSGMKGDNEDQSVGIMIIRKALQAPLRQIAQNAGVDGSVVVGKIIENDSKTYGYDAQLDTYGDMLKAGVIDPTKVVRIALEYAASVAGLLITTEAMIGEKPSKSGGGNMPDMSGMM